MDFSPPRLAAWLGNIGLLLSGSAALGLWFATRGERTFTSSLDCGRYGLVLAFGAATWLSAGPLRIPIPVRFLVACGLASIAAMAIRGVDEIPEAEGRRQFLRICLLIVHVTIPAMLLARPVLWGSAMACHDPGPDPRSLAANRIAAIVILASQALGLIAYAALTIVMNGGWNLRFLPSWRQIAAQTVIAASFAFLLSAAVQSITLASAGSLPSRALRIHHLILTSVATELVLAIVWCLVVDSRILLYRVAAVLSQLLSPVFLSLILSLQLRACWSAPHSSPLRSEADR